MSLLAHQKHSETSREAAQTNSTAASYRKEIERLIMSRNTNGMTNDEISAYYQKTGSYFSPRLIELQRSGAIIKLTATRITRGGKRANVYVHSYMFDSTYHTKLEEAGKQNKIEKFCTKLLDMILGDEIQVSDLDKCRIQTLAKEAGL